MTLHLYRQGKRAPVCGQPRPRGQATSFYTTRNGEDLDGEKRELCPGCRAWQRAR